MSKHKHTPGPWRNNGQTVYDSEGDDICTCGDVVHDEHLANAYLIAACPDLLEALREIVDHATRYKAAPLSATLMFDRARAAIAKATGKEG